MVRQWKMVVIIEAQQLFSSDFAIFEINRPYVHGMVDDLLRHRSSKLRADSLSPDSDHGITKPHHHKLESLEL